MFIERAKPSGSEHRATARDKTQPPERKDEREERQRNPTGTDARATRGSLTEDGAARSESQAKANEERGGENSEHDRTSKEHKQIEAPRRRQWLFIWSRTYRRMQRELHVDEQANLL